MLERWRWDAAGTPTFVLATLELGRIAEGLGEREKAIESYEFVTDVWRADPELEPYVTEARIGRLAKITSERVSRRDPPTAQLSETGSRIHRPANFDI